MYDKVSAALGFVNVACLRRKCDFCETGIEGAFLFPFEDEYLQIKNNTKIPTEEINSIKILGIAGASCKFYRNKRCRIQRYKPLECKLYPLLIWEGRKFVNLELDLRCPEATELMKNKQYLKHIIPPLSELLNCLPRDFFIKRGALPAGMRSGLKKVKITALRAI